MIDELKELNDKFFDLFREVNEARPDLDEAFPIFIKNVLEQYNTDRKSVV